MWSLNKPDIITFFSKSNLLLNFEIPTDAIVVLFSYKINSKFKLCIFASPLTISIFCFLKFSSFSFLYSSLISILPWFWNFFHCSLVSENRSSYRSQETAFSLNAIDTSEFPYHSLDEHCRAPKLDPNVYPQIPDNQLINLTEKDLRYHKMSVNRTNSALQCFNITCDRELNKRTQTATELKFGLFVMVVGLTSHPIPTSTQIKHRTFPCPFPVTNSSSLTNLHRAINGEV